MTEPITPSPQPAPPAASAAQQGMADNSALGVVWELVQTVVLALVIFLLIRNVIANFRIDGISMEPNFHNREFLIVNRFSYCPGFHLDINPLNVHVNKAWCIWQPKRGDVVVFEYPRDISRDFIKRVIGLPGDVVEVRSGRVYVNGEPIAEPYGPNPGSYSAGPITIAPDEYYVMGDNRNNSADSHVWGSLPIENIIGKAFLSYWPPSNWALVPSYNLPGPVSGSE